eukprot:EG_transcript_53468
MSRVGLALLAGIVCILLLAVPPPNALLVVAQQFCSPVGLTVSRPLAAQQSRLRGLAPSRKGQRQFSSPFGVVGDTPPNEAGSAVDRLRRALPFPTDEAGVAPGVAYRSAVHRLAGRA